MSPFRFKHFVVFHQKSTMPVGTDAMLLGAWTKPHGHKLLEVGTGCGVIALMLAQKTQAHITAIDIDRPSIEEAAENVANSKWHKQIMLQQISMQLFSDQQVNGSFDHIISNPPFYSRSPLPASHQKSIAKHVTELNLEDFLGSAAKLLTHTGKISVVIPRSSEDYFLALAKARNLHPEKICRVIPKPNKDANRSLITLWCQSGDIEHRQLIIRRNDGSFTDEYLGLTASYHVRT